MNKRSALLSTSAALLWSLFVSDLGHAVQTEKRQDTLNLMAAEINGTANSSTTQVTDTPNSCTVGAKGRTRATCGKQSLPGSGEKATVQSQYLNAVITATVTVMLIILIVLAALSLALITLAAWSRRIPHLTLERARINLSLSGQRRRTSLWVRCPPLGNIVYAGSPRRAWLVGFVWLIWSLWFLWFAGSFDFFRSSNQTN